MISPNSKLAQNPVDKTKLEQVPTRMGFGKGLVQAGEKEKNVVALCCDLTISTQVSPFAEKFPDRYIEVGIAEQNLACIGAGMALQGKIPFLASYASFSPGRSNEQVRTAICIGNVPVKIGGMHAGVSVGPDGMTHQALEDIALMRVLPRMVVVVPCDALESQKATFASAFNGKPTYLRFGREKTPVFTTTETPFEIGRAEIFREGKDVTIVGCGSLLFNAMVAAEELAGENIDCEVINSHTIKPLDGATILTSVQKTGCLVSVEEHQIAGGLGSAVSEFLSQNYPVPQEFIGARDRFGETGQPDELLTAMKMDVPAIKESVKKVTSRKS
ncbi:MAG: transketolase C-terminal domain-containing protein [Minisyncoccia bacterium]